MGVYAVYAAKIEQQAKKELEKIKAELARIFEPQVYANMQTLKIFSDGNAHQWREVLQQVTVSKQAMAKRLKLLLKNGCLERHVVVTTIPPSVYYKLPANDVGEFLASCGKILKLAEEVAEGRLFIALACAELKDNNEIYRVLDATLEELKQQTEFSVVEGLSFPDEDLFVAFRSYVIMLRYLAAVKVFKLLQAEAEQYCKNINVDNASDWAAEKAKLTKLLENKS